MFTHPPRRSAMFLLMFIPIRLTCERVLWAATAACIAAGESLRRSVFVIVAGVLVSIRDARKAFSACGTSLLG